MKEPIAQVADFIQRLFVQLGLVDASTQTWGDSLRQIQEIGMTVVSKLAYAFGYLEGVFKILGGAVVKLVIAPLQSLLAEVLGLVNTVFQKIAENSKGWVKRQAQEMADMAKQTGESLQKNADNWNKIGDELILANPGETAREREKNATTGVKKGQWEVEWDRMMHDFFAECAKWTANIEENAAMTAELGGGGSTAAVIQGSREEANVLAKVRGEAADVQAKQLAAAQDNAKAAERNAAATEDVGRKMQQLLDRFDEISVA